MADTNNQKHFLKSLWPYILVATAIFVVTVIIGLFVNPEISRNTMEDLKETLAPLASLGPVALLIVIILNNTIKALFSIILGIIIGLPSLIFVGFQLRQDREIALAESLTAAEASFTSIDALISDHVVVWLKGRKNEELSEAETLIMSRLVSTLYRRARYTAEMRRKLGTPGTGAIRDLAIELYENQGARRIWETLSENEIAYFETMAPNDDWRRNYRDEGRAELAKLDSVKE